MATSMDEASDKKEEDTKFECNICFEAATDPVISMCGHLFCWPCIHQWMETRPDNPVCPVCKSVVDKDKLIPVYGRGSGEKEDPRKKVPPRPKGQREEPPQNESNGFFNPFDMGGVNVQFGVGGFPFGFGFGPTIAFQTGQRGFRRRTNGGHSDNEQRQMMARLMLTLALLFIIMIIIS